MEAPKRINLDVLKQGDDWIAMEHGAVSLSPASEYVQDVAYVRAADADALADAVLAYFTERDSPVVDQTMLRNRRAAMLVALAAYRETK